MGEPDGARGNRRGQRGARTPSTCFPKGTGELTVTRQLSQCNPAGECGQHEREQSAGGSWREQVEGERRGTVKPERREAFCRSKAGETSWWSTSQVQQLAQLAGASPSGGDGRWFKSTVASKHKPSPEDNESASNPRPFGEPRLGELARRTGFVGKVVQAGGAPSAESKSRGVVGLATSGCRKQPGMTATAGMSWKRRELIIRAKGRYGRRLFSPPPKHILRRSTSR